MVVNWAKPMETPSPAGGPGSQQPRRGVVCPSSLEYAASIPPIKRPDERTGSEVGGQKLLSSIEQRFRPDIEGLRALAVLSVVGFHYGFPGLRGGFIGVDVFFVISGYLITQLLLREYDRSGSISFLNFYGRRAKRLLPAAIVVTLATLMFGYVVLAPFEQQAMAKSAAAASLYVTNIFLLQSAFDYFAPESSLNPFLHTWSLAVEEQFYFVWPALLLVIQRYLPRSLIPSLVAACAISFALCYYLTFARQAYAFYLSPTRAWEFGIGALSTQVSARPSSRISWLALVTLVSSFFLLEEWMPFPGAVAIVPVFATAILLISSANGSGPALLLSHPLLQFFGLRSYALYLWHWPVVVLGSIAYGATAPHMALYFGLSVALASLSYSWVEHPVRSSRWLAIAPQRAAFLGAGLTAFGAAASAISLAVAHNVTSPAQTTIRASTAERSLADQTGCLAGFTIDRPIRCEFGERTNFQKTIVLLGDSHADQWTTALAQIAKDRNWRLITYLKSSCPIADIPAYNVRLRRAWPECIKWREAAISSARQEKPDAILISQFSSGYVAGEFTTLGPFAVSLETWTSGLLSAVRPISESGATLIFLRDNPTPKEPVGSCLARAEWRAAPLTKCDRPLSEALDRALIQAEQGAIDSVNGAHVIDLTQRICTENNCRAMKGGTVVYRDANHLTIDYTLQLKDALASILASILDPVAQ